MRNEFIVFGKPSLTESEIDAVSGVVRSGWLGTGPKVKEFTTVFQRYKGVENALMLNSCTSALHLSMVLSGVGEGDEVITTSMTFAATINSILYTGATAVLVDIDPLSKNLDYQKIKKSITKKTKAILAVHFAGYPLDLKELRAICDEYNLKLIEDCAHAIETVCDGEKAGTVGDYACFSFYSTKNIAVGEGGALICKSKKDLDRATILSLHGMSRDAWKRFSETGYNHYDVVEVGYKYNMMDIQAALGIVQFSRIKSFMEIREKVFNSYEHNIENKKIIKPQFKVNEFSYHGKHLYIIEFVNENNRDDFLNYMAANKIGVGVHYRSILDLSVYKNNSRVRVDEPISISKKFGDSCVSLPLSNCLTEEQIKRVCEVVNRY